MQAWETSIDRQLVARLVRPIVRPGVIRMTLVRRILAGVAAMTARLPLLARFNRRRELAATTPIVHARWLPLAPVETATPRPVAHPIVHARASRVLERSSAPAPATAAPRELSAPATVSPIAPNHAMNHAPNHAIERLVERVPAPPPALEPPATVTRERPSEARPEASRASSREPAGSADPVVRRSRVGAPLPARPQIARPIADHGQDPARPLTAPSAPAAATSSSRASGVSLEQLVGEIRARGATANAVVRVRPRAFAAGLPAMTAATVVPARTPVVAPEAPRPPLLPVATIRPTRAPADRHERSLVERRSMPVVPARSVDGERARAMELPLAHPSPVTAPAAAPAAIAVVPSAATPHPVAALHPLGQAAVPPAPPSQKIDLPRLAEQVQRILVRQTAHARARQGLPR